MVRRMSMRRMSLRQMPMRLVELGTAGVQFIWTLTQSNSNC